MTSTRRILATGSAALMAAAVLAGCSSSSEPSGSTPSPTASDAAGMTMLPPIIIQVDQSEATAKVGDMLDILLSDNEIGGTNVVVDKPELIEVVQAYEQDGAMFNAGGKVLAPGTAVLTITYPDGRERSVTVTITE